MQLFSIVNMFVNNILVYFTCYLQRISFITQLIVDVVRKRGRQILDEELRLDGGLHEPSELRVVSAEQHGQHVHLATQGRD